MLIDAHLHLQDIREVGVRAEILSRAWDSDLHQFWCNATNPDDWRSVEELASLDDRIIPFWGVHPWYAAKAEEGWDKELERVLKGRRAGIGEAGLDKARNIDPVKQVEVLSRQIEIAGRIGCPLTLHCAQAWGDLLEILKKNLLPGTLFMVHSYYGSPETMRELLRLGGFISFSWKNVRRDSKGQEALLRNAPLDRLLLETDFPYTEPGKIGADIFAEKYFESIRELYRFAAQVKTADETTLEKAVWENGTAFLSGAPAR